MSAGHRVIRRKGYAAATVAEILTEAGLSTRAFYRHFRAKDDLLLAIYEHETAAVETRLDAALGAAATSGARFEAWLDEMLALVFDDRRARRTRLLRAEAGRISAERPEMIADIVERQVGRLAGILGEGRADGTFPLASPAEDARTIHAIVWNLTDPRYAPGEGLDREQAREHVLRFVMPGLGAKPVRRARKGVSHR